MKNTCLQIIIILAFTANIFGQEGFSLQLGIGYAFQNKTTPDKLDFYDSNTIGIRFGTNYQKVLNDRFLFELGLIGKYNRGNRETELVNFVSHNLRVQLPFYIGVKPANRFIFKAGFGVENNRDLNNLDFTRKDHNLRLDFLTKTNYLYSEEISFTIFSSWSMSSAPGVYTINSPDNAVYLGIAYQFK